MMENKLSSNNNYRGEDDTIQAEFDLGVAQVEPLKKRGTCIPGDFRAWTEPRPRQQPETESDGADQS